MRTPPLFVFATLSLALAPVAFSQAVVDFNTPGDLTNRFAINGTASSFSQVASGGITGGAVDVLLNNASDTAIFRTASPGGVGSTLQVSVFFRYDATLRDPFNSRAPLTLGFSTSTSVNSTFPFSFIGGVDVGVYLQTFNSGNPLIFPVLFTGDSQSSSVVASSQTVLGGGTLVSGDWYRLTLGLQIVGGAFNQVTLSTALDDFGPTGQSPVPVNLPTFSGSASFNNANVAGASQLFGGFRSMRDGGADLLDNFSATVPEPATWVALVVGGGLLLRIGGCSRRRGEQHQHRSALPTKG